MVFFSINITRFYSERKFFYISQKNSLQDFNKILTSKLIYELILIKIYDNANIIKKHIFYDRSYDLKDI